MQFCFLEDKKNLHFELKCSTLYYKEGFMAFSIRLTTAEKKLANSYAAIHSISVGEAFKRALFEKIEDEYDIAIANVECEKYEKTKEGIPIQELWDELGL